MPHLPIITNPPEPPGHGLAAGHHQTPVIFDALNGLLIVRRATYTMTSGKRVSLRQRQRRVILAGLLVCYCRRRVSPGITGQRILPGGCVDGFLLWRSSLFSEEHFSLQLTFFWIMIRIR